MRQKCRRNIEHPIDTLHGGANARLVYKVADYDCSGAGGHRRLLFIGTSDKATHVGAALRKFRNHHPGELSGGAYGQY
jgi:hypothetical protein